MIQSVFKLPYHPQNYNITNQILPSTSCRISVIMHTWPTIHSSLFSPLPWCSFRGKLWSFEQQRVAPRFESARAFGCQLGGAKLEPFFWAAEMPHLRIIIYNTSRFSCFFLGKKKGPSFLNLMKGCKIPKHLNSKSMAIRPTFWRSQVDKLWSLGKT